MTETKRSPSRLAVLNELFRPVLIRGGVALIFGLMVFIINSFGETGNHPGWVNFTLAGYLIFTGVGLWEYLRQETVPEELRSPVSMAAAVTVLGTATLVGVFFFNGSAAVTAGVTGAVLLLMGFAEIASWNTARKLSFTPARDYLLTGLIDIIAGVALLAGLLTFDGRWVLGIAGTGALLIGVIWFISGIGFYMDVRRGTRAGWDPETDTGGPVSQQSA